MTEKLVIKGEDLQEAYSRIVTLHGEFDSATSRSDDAASAVGHDGLKSELENVASSWRIHRGKLLESLTDIESQIKGVLDTFGDVDDRMAQNLRGVGSSDSNPQPAPSTSTPPPGATPPAPSAPAPAAPQAPAAPVAPAPPQERQATDVPETTPTQTSDPSGTSTDEPGLGDPNHVDITDFPPEMQNLLLKMKDLMSSPDFIARYPQFAAGASLGALLPLVMAGKFADSGLNGGGLESAREQVRKLLRDVHADAVDGHMNVMTASDARAELERLLAGTDDHVDAPAGDVPLPTDQEGSTDVASDPGTPAPVTDSPAEAPASEEPRPEPATSGGSAAGGGFGSGNADWRKESPMQNEDPASLAQPSAGQPSGGSPSVGDASGVAAVAGAGTAAAVAGSVGNAATGSVGAASFVGEPAAAPSSPAAASHIPTPMMSTGSMTGGGMGQSVGTGSVTQPMSSSASNSGGQTSTSSSRSSEDKATTDRRSSTTEDQRAEKDAK